MLWCSGQYEGFRPQSEVKEAISVEHTLTARRCARDFLPSALGRHAN